jgi:hypothetical protein
LLADPTDRVDRNNVSSQISDPMPTFARIKNARHCESGTSQHIAAIAGLCRGSQPRLHGYLRVVSWISCADAKPPSVEAKIDAAIQKISVMVILAS